jgi:hypothetical protein
MPTRSGKNSRDVEIPVKVIPDTARPLDEAVPVPPPPAPKKAPVKKTPSLASRLNQSTAAMSEAHRRRMMRWIVISGAVVIVGGWLSILRFEIQDTSKNNILSTLVHSITSFHFGTNTNSSPKQEEIHQYEQQVFPQFSNTNQ